MAERRKPKAQSAPEVVEAESVEVEETTVAPYMPVSPQVAEDNSNKELAEHVKNLVTLYFDQVVQEISQRISDLELLMAQPKGAVEFEIPPQPQSQVPDYVPQHQHQGRSSEVPWYQG